MRIQETFNINPIVFKQQLMAWGNTQTPFLLLDSNGYSTQLPQSGYKALHHYDAIAAVGAYSVSPTETDNCWEALYNWKQDINDWAFGFLTYDLKNTTEALFSEHEDGIGFPAMKFFQPQCLVIIQGHSAIVSCVSQTTMTPQQVFECIMAVECDAVEEYKTTIHVQAKVSKEQYVQAIHDIKQHIKRGDIYEMNYCMEFYAHAKISPRAVFSQLNRISPTPFACYLCWENLYLMSASPERYLKKEGNHIVSQPIKGTIKRGQTEAEDTLLISQLKQNTKEQSENVMIVDLVRNDLSMTAVPGSVHVAELMGVYTFKQVHQMISTVTSQLSPAYTWKDVLKTTFPMGSMTGAPKKRVMQLIEQYETTKRGLYSGAVGYITPDGDFDFNVVIRSIQYNAATQYVSYMVGSAITYHALAEQEHAECLLKANAIEQTLKG